MKQPGVATQQNDQRRVPNMFQGVGEFTTLEQEYQPIMDMGRQLNQMRNQEREEEEALQREFDQDDAMLQVEDRDPADREMEQYDTNEDRGLEETVAIALAGLSTLQSIPQPDLLIATTAMPQVLPLITELEILNSDIAAMTKQHERDVVQFKETVLDLQETGQRGNNTAELTQQVIDQEANIKNNEEIILAAIDKQSNVAAEYNETVLEGNKNKTWLENNNDMRFQQAVAESEEFAASDREKNNKRESYVTYDPVQDFQMRPARKDMKTRTPDWKQVNQLLAYNRVNNPPQYRYNNQVYNTPVSVPLETQQEDPRVQILDRTTSLPPLHREQAYVPIDANVEPAIVLKDTVVKTLLGQFQTVFEQVAQAITDLQVAVQEDDMDTDEAVNHIVGTVGDALDTLDAKVEEEVTMEVQEREDLLDEDDMQDFLQLLNDKSEDFVEIRNDLIKDATKAAGQIVRGIARNVVQNVLPLAHNVASNVIMAVADAYNTPVVVPPQNRMEVEYNPVVPTLKRKALAIRDPEMVQIYNPEADVVQKNPLRAYPRVAVPAAPVPTEQDRNQATNFRAGVPIAKAKKPAKKKRNADQAVANQAVLEGKRQRTQNPDMGRSNSNLGRGLERKGRRQHLSQRLAILNGEIAAGNNNPVILLARNILLRQGVR